MCRLWLWIWHGRGVASIGSGPLSARAKPGRPSGAGKKQKAGKQRGRARAAVRSEVAAGRFGVDMGGTNHLNPRKQPASASNPANKQNFCGECKLFTKLAASRTGLNRFTRSCEHRHTPGPARQPGPPRRFQPWAVAPCAACVIAAEISFSASAVSQNSTICAIFPSRSVTRSTKFVSTISFVGMKRCLVR